MQYVVLIGRIFFSYIFIQSIITHFSQAVVQYSTAAGVPFPSVLVPLSGAIAMLGGLSVALGYKAKIGGWLIVLFLVPVTLTMHNFWAITDPAAYQMQYVNFMKNLSMLGGALFITYFGAGPLSIDSIIVKDIESETRREKSPRFSREYEDRRGERRSRRTKEKEKSE